MSGICGVINTRLDPVSLRDRIAEMTGTLIHRGPDAEIIYVEDQVGFGMRIFNIFSHPVDQKLLSNEDQSVLLFADCEIYNYQSLREELIKKGHRFSGDTDAEVIVHLYEDLGEKCVDRLRGVFAFAIWDSKKRKLLLYRDRLGTRPIYYSRAGNTFIFASEMKAILKYGTVNKALNYNALDDLLTFRLIPEPMTIYTDIHKLPAGQYLTYRSNEMSIQQYWDYHYIENEIKHIGEYEERLLELLKEAVSIRLIGDLSYGSFLSGGMDSSSVVSLLGEMVDRPVKTFSIAFKEKGYDESYYQRIVANYCKTNHHEFIVEKERVEELLPRIVSFFDQPFGDSSALPSYYLAKMTRQYVTAVMTGDGGDELLAGYTTYPGMLYSEHYRKLPGFISAGLIPKVVNRLGLLAPGKYAYTIERFQKIIHDALLPFEERYKRKVSWARQEQKDRLYLEQTRMKILEKNEPIVDQILSRPDCRELLNRVNYVDVRFRFVNTVLEKTERMCIANSLIARSPYLDHKLVEFAATVPPKFKLKGFKTKYLLHRAMGDKLPKEVHSKQKHGFEPPLALWFKDELEPYVRKMLLSKDSRVLNYFKKEGLEETIGIHKEGKKNLGEHLWGLLIFELWHRLYMD